MLLCGLHVCTTVVIIQHVKLSNYWMEYGGKFSPPGEWNTSALFKLALTLPSCATYICSHLSSARHFHLDGHYFLWIWAPKYQYSKNCRYTTKPNDLLICFQAEVYMYTALPGSVAPHPPTDRTENCISGEKSMWASGPAGGDSFTSQHQPSS